MYIAIINELRTGSSNLIKWFSYQQNFTALLAPTQKKSFSYQCDNIEDIKYNTKHLITKNDYHYDLDYKYQNIIKYSDKQIFLYRENEKEQFESIVSCRKMCNWYSEYVYKNDFSDLEYIENIYLKKNKKIFYDKYLSKNNIFKVSYEELYYKKTGLKRIIDYLEINELKDEGFPIGKKYRQYNQDINYIPVINNNYNYLEDVNCNGLPFSSKLREKKLL